MRIRLLSLFVLLLSVSGMTMAQSNFTNADYYKDGVFQKDVARKAVRELLEKHGVEWTSQIEQNIWISDFGLGDYEHVGLASVTWLNDGDYGYFAMTMYLLPGQMVPEHIHRPIKESQARPAKHESWRVMKGFIYNFSEVGDETPNAPRLADAFEGKTKSRHFEILRPNDTARLKKTETYHFMRAGEAGAIVDEYGVHHDRRGWSSSISNAKP